MREVSMIAGGVALILAALWGGAWLCEVFPNGGYNFAAVMTALLVGICGYALAGNGFVNWKD